MSVPTLPLAATVVDGLSSLPPAALALLGVAIALALAFEFVNGFHDTANAVATVIYTHTLRPWTAVVWSGLCNLTGVLTSNGLVAYTILALLPADLVLHVGSAAGFAMIFALLISAILWNLGTWYLGLPASSSHTLIGSIIGVGLANAALSGHRLADGVNWGKVREVFVFLAVSPLIGFIVAGVVLVALKRVVRNPALYQAPPKDAPPPRWIRGILVLTCTGVSFFHGSNDGQKGLGLVLLILIAILPAEYALNLHADPADVRRLSAGAALVQPMLDADAARAAADPARRAAAAAERPVEAGNVAAAVTREAVTAGSAPNDPNRANAAELSQYLQNGGTLSAKTYAALAAANRELADIVHGSASLADVPDDRRTALRTDLYVVNLTVAKLLASGQVADPGQSRAFADYHRQLDRTTQHIPTWVKVAVALALGCGTMVGWKRIVTTVGEKIGKQHLTYAQGMSAELVAMATIGAGDRLHMPISTTHVLSGGIAGTMAANGSGLQMATLRNIVLAWVLTLPVCVVMGAMLFAAGLVVVLSHGAAVVAVAAVALVAAVIGWRVMARRARPTSTAAVPPPGSPREPRTEGTLAASGPAPCPPTAAVPSVRASLHSRSREHAGV